MPYINPYGMYQPMYQGIPNMQQYQPTMQQPMQNPVPQSMQQPAQQAQAQPESNPTQSGRIWVPNEQAANNYLVAPNSAVDLWDMNSPVVYLKQADASGKPTMTIYDLVERTPNRMPVQSAQAPAPDYVTHSELEAHTARLDALAARIEAMSSKAEKEAAE